MKAATMVGCVVCMGLVSLASLAHGQRAEQADKEKPNAVDAQVVLGGHSGLAVDARRAFGPGLRAGLRGTVTRSWFDMPNVTADRNLRVGVLASVGYAHQLGRRWELSLDAAMGAEVLFLDETVDLPEYDIQIQEQRRDARWTRGLIWGASFRVNDRWGVLATAWLPLPVNLYSYDTFQYAHVALGARYRF